MKNNYNSIKYIEYLFIKKLLDEIINNHFPSDKKIQEISNLSLTICALFVAIKEKKYRESSLLLLNHLIRIHTFKFVQTILQNDETKSYKITSLDILPKTRKEIIEYMFSKLEDKNFYHAIVFSLGFYLTPEIIDILKKYKKSDNKIIQREATYAINFIERK